MLIGGDEAGNIAPSLFFRIAWKLGFHPDGEGVSDWLLHEASREAPSLIWIEKGNMIRPGVLRRLRILCPHTIIASYTDDDMYSRSNRTWAYRRGLQYYDLV